MPPNRIHGFPVNNPTVAGLVIVLGLALAFIEIAVIEYSFEKIGIPHRQLFSLLLLSLLGSWVNIPVGKVRLEPPTPDGRTHTILAVNLGGAIVPTLLSLYLLATTGLFVAGLAATAIVTVATHALARPVRGLGIAVPMFVPPLVAAAAALVLSGSGAPAVAYVSGSLGTLIGADLLNLRALRALGAPVASIGGAGTFDGIFLTGILAVLLA